MESRQISPIHSWLLKYTHVVELLMRFNAGEPDVHLSTIRRSVEKRLFDIPDCSAKEFMDYVLTNVVVELNSPILSNVEVERCIKQLMDASFVLTNGKLGIVPVKADGTKDMPLMTFPR